VMSAVPTPGTEHERQDTCNRFQSGTATNQGGQKQKSGYNSRLNPTPNQGRCSPITITVQFKHNKSQIVLHFHNIRWLAHNYTLIN